MRLALTTLPVAALAWGAILTACVSQSGPPPLREFDSVYGSTNHMAPTERIVRTSAPPEKVLAVLRDELERSSATEIATADSLAVSVSAEEDARWLERQRIAKEEWAAYARRSRRDLNAIERPKGLDSAPPEDLETTAIQLSARVWEREAAFEDERVSKSGNTTTTRHTVTSKPLASEIFFRIWRGDDGATHVYAIATPIIEGKTQSESPSVGLEWLLFARGHDEARLVRSYLSILQRRLPPAP
jgi:hypothetical protein